MLSNAIATTFSTMRQWHSIQCPRLNPATDSSVIYTQLLRDFMNSEQIGGPIHLFHFLLGVRISLFPTGHKRTSFITQERYTNTQFKVIFYALFNYTLRVFKQ